MKYKPYPRYKDSGIEWLREVPKGWDIKKLKYLAKIKNGQDQKQVLIEDGGFPVYGSGGEFGRAYQYLYNQKSVLLGRKGTIDKPLFIQEPFWTVDTMYYTKIFSSVFPKFFFYQCLTIEFNYYQFGSTVPSMTQESLHNNYFAVPNFQEQTTIANFLDRETLRIDALAEEKNHFIGLLKEKRLALISHVVTKGLDTTVKMKDSGVEWLGEVPEHWMMSYLKFVTYKIIDTEHKTATFYEDGEYHVVRTSDVKNGRLIFKSAKYTNHEVYLEWTARGTPEAGDILFTREAPAGEACIVPTNSQICLGQRMVLFKVNHKKILPMFLLYSLYGGLSDDFIRQLSQGSTVIHLNMADIKNIPLFEIPINEQQSIVQYLEQQTTKIDSLITETQQSIALLKEHRTALISAAVTGKIDVREVA
ncbi:MAG: restriction endonuclease subunit S [Methylococcaceae bacterium]